MPDDVLVAEYGAQSCVATGDRVGAAGIGVGLLLGPVGARVGGAEGARSAQ